MITQKRRILHRYGNLSLLLGVFMVTGIFLGLAAIAQVSETKRLKKAMKGVSGEVSGISKDFIAIVYRRDETRGSEEEIGLPIAKDVIVEHKKSLSEIAVGDMVDVEFEEAEEETKDGARSRRVAKVVRFIRAAPQEAQTTVLGSGAQEEEKE